MRCHEPIAQPDQVVRLAQQVDVTGMNPAGQREWADGLVSCFHEWCAPQPQVGVWRRIA
jgi:hypothetical protein